MATNGRRSLRELNGKRSLALTEWQTLALFAEWRRMSILFLLLAIKQSRDCVAIKCH